MLLGLAVALAIGIVAYAFWRVPRWVGVVPAVAGLVVYGAAGYVWFLALFVVPPRLFEPIVLALRRMQLDGLVFALLVYFAPPLIAALFAVHLLARATDGDRTRVPG